MYFKILVFMAVLSILIFSLIFAEPSFNGTTPGCAGSGCHNLQTNDVTAVSIGNLAVEVTLSGVNSGENVGGELVGVDGTVIDFVNSTNSNPFVLTALNPGIYTVNAGYKEPSRNWDFTQVDLTVTSVGTNSPENLSSSYQLSQNYPNPFNPSTTIEFSIPQSEFVTLKVYNLLGQEVTTLVSDNLNASDYSYSWDAGSLAGGVYIYKMQAGSFQQINKMILLK
jgi:type IX secretion system substrate protein